MADGPDSPGSVSQTVSFQLWLGARLDGAYHLNGALDDTRLYRRALAPSEVDSARRGADVRPGPVLQLPFDRIRS
jgi:sialidase-1